MIPKPASQLTRADVVAALRRLARNGTLTARKVARNSPTLYLAAGRLWGSFPRARRAAGIAGPPQRLLWTRERILAEIRALHRAGQRMTSKALCEAGHAPLLGAATRHLGSWSRARDLAGVPVPKPERQPSEGWDRRGVIAEIKHRRRAGLPLASSKVPSSLRNGAVTIFGSWRAAIEAAGFDYRRISLKVVRDDEELLDWLRSLARKHPKMILTEVKRARHGLTCIRRWGSVEDAARAAGLEGWPVRRAHPQMTKDEVLAELRAMARAGTPLHQNHVRHGLGHLRLVRGAASHFASWDDAIAAAGLPPQRRQRAAWSRDEVIAYLRRRRRQGHSLAVREVLKDEPSFQEITRRLFSSYAGAVAAAGLTYRPLRVRRSRHEILEELRTLARRRRVLRRRDVSKALLATINKQWGSFAAACVEAGVPYQVQRKAWTREELIRELRKAARGRKVLPQHDVAPKVVVAARTAWGTWKDACAAAGLAVEILREEWSEERLIAELRAAAAKRKGLRWRDIPPRVYDAAQRRWGTWAAVCAAAGVAHRFEHEQWTSARVLDELRRAARGRSRLRLGDISARLAGAAVRYYGRFSNACDAAGVAHGRS